MSSEDSSQYRVDFTTGARKDLKSKACKPHLKEIFKAIKTLKTDPMAGEPLEGSLLKVRSLHFTLKGSGQWRAAYYVMVDNKLCLILAIAPRENFYQRAEDRYKAVKAKLNKG